MAQDTTGWHRLSEIDPVARTGICSICGPVKVRLRNGRRGAECEAVTRRHKRPGKHGGKTKPETARRYRRRRRYGIDAARLAELEAITLCPICLREGQPMHIDHDHSCCSDGRSVCGECVRGAICRDCNIGLGRFRDDVESLRRAIAYLHEATAPTV